MKHGRMCVVCGEHENYSQSGACFECLKDAQLALNKDGEPLKPFDDGRRRTVYAARYRYRAVRCGKKDCPCRGGSAHYWYVYRQWRVGDVGHEKYMGPADELLGPYELPQLREPKNGGWVRQRR